MSFLMLTVLARSSAGGCQRMAAWWTARGLCDWTSSGHGVPAAAQALLTSSLSQHGARAVVRMSDPDGTLCRPDIHFVISVLVY